MSWAFHRKVGRRSGILSLLLMIWIGLAGCARDDLVGTFEDDLGMTRYEFLGKGRVNISVLGATVVAEYRLDHDRVLVTGPQGTLVLIRSDDELHGPMGLSLHRISRTSSDSRDQ